jgi:flap endonuclease-1
VRLRRAGIEPVFIFDGRTPAAKIETVERRREARVLVKHKMASIRAEEIITLDNELRLAELQSRIPHVSSRDRDDVKRLLYAAGVLFVTATGEADDLLGYLARTGQVCAVVSTDMDMLARGVSVLVHPDTPDMTVLSEFSLSGILSGLGVSYTQFVDACMLMGSDYTPHDVRTLSPPDAIEAVRDAKIGSIVSDGSALLRGEGVTWESLLADSQREKWMIGPPLVEYEQLAEYCAEHMWPMDWRRALSGEVTST